MAMAKKVYENLQKQATVAIYYLKSNARVAFDPGLYDKGMSKSDLYHLKPLLIIHKGGS